MNQDESELCTHKLCHCLGINCENRLESVIPVRPPYLPSAASHPNISVSTANHFLFIKVIDECTAIMMAVYHSGAISHRLESVSLYTADNFFDISSVRGSIVVVQADITEYVALMQLLYSLARMAKL